jgi:hypothetical protein
MAAPFDVERGAAENLRSGRELLKRQDNKKEKARAALDQPASIHFSNWQAFLLFASVT